LVFECVLAPQNPVTGIPASLFPDSRR
jgi:hypothetical protein